MANYNPRNARDAVRSADNGGNRSVYKGDVAVTANIVAADKVRMVLVPGGTIVDRVVIKNADLDSGAALAVNLGFENVDGSAGPSATAIAAAATTWQAAATTTYELFPPVKLEKDAYLVATATVGGTGTGTVYGKVEGEAVGMK